ncbi:SurA N-terminal domain-containing protein [Patescibacteria group bacterium]|nr:SurA N-terminal domain-containing protein [Patescibacteria group bacterium]MCL5410070.1 SurA N-terminal domain-containing protein [Patescibacteria group bacterium]
MPRSSKAHKATTQSEEAEQSSITSPRKAQRTLVLPSNPLRGFRFSKGLIIVLIFVVLLALAYYKKSWFIAATVDGAPITNLELQNALNQQYRSQVLNQLINEKILTDEAQKQGVVVTNADIDNRITQIEQSVGGASTLDSLLSQQGQDRQSLRDQVKINLIIEKLYSNEATVSADEINQYIKNNQGQFSSSDSAQQQQEAKDALQQQKLQQVFSDKFQTLKQQANVKIF